MWTKPTATPCARDPSSAARPNARAVAVADAVMEWQRHNGAVFDIRGRRGWERVARAAGAAWSSGASRAEHDRALTRGKGPAHDGRP